MEGISNTKGDEIRPVKSNKERKKDESKLSKQTRASISQGKPNNEFDEVFPKFEEG